MTDLLVGWQDGVAAPMVDVHRPPVVVLQRGSHHHIIEPIVVEVWGAGHGVTEAGVLQFAVSVERAIQGKEHLHEKVRTL